MKNILRLKPPDVRLILAALFCAAFFIAQDATEDKICAKHKYGNLVVQNKAMDKRIHVNLAALSYEEHGLYNRSFYMDPGETLTVKDIRTGIYLCVLTITNASDHSWADVRSLTLTIDESKTTTVSYP